MSNSAMISKSFSGNNRMESEDPYSTVYVENLIGVDKLELT
jgi:hypothetical protein